MNGQLVTEDPAQWWNELPNEVTTGESLLNLQSPFSTHKDTAF